MSLRRAAAAIMVLAVTTVLAQESTPANAPVSGPSGAAQTRQSPIPMRRWGRGAMANKQAGAVPQPSLSQRVQDMQSTVEKMHVVLKQMRAKSGATSKDPIVKANLEMWGLVVDQLEKQLQELKLAEANRADMEARRAAMYKQAEIKSQAAAGAAQQAMFSHQPTGSTVATQPAGQNAGEPAPAASQAPRQTPNTASPN